MINTQELRQLNWVKYNNWNKDGSPAFFMVRDIYWDDKKISLSNGVFMLPSPSMDMIEPIPLSEEWFKFFGFKKEKDLKLYRLEIEIGWIEILPKVGGEEFVFYWKDAHIAKIKYVHELQNLFFALTHEELTQVSEGKNKNFV